MKLSNEVVEYILTELQSRLEVLDDLLLYEEDESALDGWNEEYLKCEQAIKELHDADL